MRFLLFSVVILSVVYQAYGNGQAIVTAARSQLNVPYSWGGGNWSGKSKGIGSGAHTIGFDCSGLAQYSVYHGTHKKIARVAAAQYNDKQCHHVPLGQHLPGDLVFFGHPIHHVGIAISATHMINAPHTGDHVREAAIWPTERVANVARCW